MQQYYYAVQKGKHPGIYKTWEECRREVEGVGGAVYKKFRALREAEAFLSMQGYSQKGSGNAQGSAVAAAKADDRGKERDPGKDANPDLELTTMLANTETDCLSFVDGSYNAAKKCYGYGAILILPDGSYETFQGAGADPGLVPMRNVAGEIAGAMRAVEEAIRKGFSSMTLCYDYMGIACWATGSWKCNKEGTAAYHAFMAEKMREIRISFQKVRAHSGVRFNELADRLAKDAAGVR